MGLVMQQTLLLDNYHPLSVNRLLKRHPERAERQKRADAQLIGGCALAQGVTRATGPRSVAILAAGWPRGRMPDPDNLSKALLDALVQAGLLIDDSQKWCRLSGIEVERSSHWWTRIILTDLVEG
jgi:Holliday junction resolvase RusA-like endonuclease